MMPWASPALKNEIEHNFRMKQAIKKTSDHRHGKRSSSTSV
jgi:hypothetical protein